MWRFRLDNLLNLVLHRLHGYMRGDNLGLVRGDGSLSSLFRGREVGFMAFRVALLVSDCLPVLGRTGVAGRGSIGSHNVSDMKDSSIISTSLAVSRSTVSMSGLRLVSLPNISAISALALVGLGRIPLLDGCWP